MDSRLSVGPTTPPVDAAPRPSRRRTPAGRRQSWVTKVIVVLAAALILAPIVAMFYHELLPGGRPNVEAFRETFDRRDIGIALRNTVIIIVLVNLFAVPLGVLFAWINYRTDARIGPLASLLPAIPLFLPPVAMVIGWVFLGSGQSGFLTHFLRLGLSLVGIQFNQFPIDIFSWPGLIAVYVLDVVPMIYVIVAAAYRSLDPLLEEAARLHGSGLFKTFATVSVPAVKHAIILSSLLVSMLCMVLYSIPAVIGTPARIPVLSVMIVRLITGEFPPRLDQAGVLSLLLVGVIGALWIVQQRLTALGRHTQIGGKGIRPNLLALGTWRLPLRALMLGFVLVASILPFLALIVVALQPFWTPQIDLGSLSFDNFRELFDEGQPRRAINNSTFLGVAGSLAALLIAAVLAMYANTAGPRAERVIGIITKAPMAFSHLVIAVGIFVVFGAAPFNLAGTIFILLIAYIIMYIPQASIAAESAIKQIGPELGEASRISGAGAGETFWRVTLPLMMPGLAAGWALIFTSIVGELTASVILAGPRNPVVGFVIMKIYDSGTYSQLAALATVIALISTVSVVVVMRLASPRFGSTSQGGG